MSDGISKNVILRESNKLITELKDFNSFIENTKYTKQTRDYYEKEVLDRLSHINRLNKCVQRTMVKHILYRVRKRERKEKRKVIRMSEQKIEQFFDILKANLENRSPAFKIRRFTTDEMRERIKKARNISSAPSYIVEEIPEQKVCQCGCEQVVSHRRAPYLPDHKKHLTEE